LPTAAEGVQLQIQHFELSPEGQLQHFEVPKPNFVPFHSLQMSISELQNAGAGPQGSAQSVGSEVEHLLPLSAKAGVDVPGPSQLPESRAHAVRNTPENSGAPEKIGMTDQIKDKASHLKDAISEKLSTTADHAKDMVSNAKEATKEKPSDAQGNSSGESQSLWQATKEKAKGLFGLNNDEPVKTTCHSTEEKGDASYVARERVSDDGAKVVVGSGSDPSELTSPVLTPQNKDTATSIFSKDRSRTSA